jgi:ketosteroid isomerase-like protein
MSNQDTLRNFYDSRAKLDLERHLGCTHPECVFQIVGTETLLPLARRLDDMGEIREAAKDLFETWDMSQLADVSSHECGDTVYVHRRGNVVYRKDGSALNTEFIDKLTFRDGRIIEYLQFIDTLGLAAFIAGKTSDADL